MTDEERLQMLAEQLIIVRDNLFQGMSKSIQKLQARSINEVLGLENFIQSPKREWVGLTDEEMHECAGEYPWTPTGLECARAIEAKLKEKNT
jgi:hypothetical protein